MTTQTPTREAEIQAARRTYIGGSDAAAVLGLSRYKTPLQLWSEKTGKIVPPDRSKELPIRMGHRLEQVVAELFAEERGVKVARVNETQVHPKYPFLRAQVDRRVVGTDEILECKTATEWLADEWADDAVPPEYIVQCLHQLAVTGKQRCYIACLIGANRDFVYKVVERDEALIEDLVRREVAFWEEYVVPQKMPGVVSADTETLLKLFPNAPVNAESIDLPAAENIAAAYEAARVAEKTAKEDKERLGNELRLLLGTSPIAVAGRYKVSWKSQSTGVRLDTERIKAEEPAIYERFGVENETRVLRVAENKPPKAKGGK